MKKNFRNGFENTSVAGITLTEKSYTPNLLLPRHQHEQTYFCFVLEGSFTENHEKNSRFCRPLTLIFHPAGELHSNHFHKFTRCFDLQVSCFWFERFQQHSKIINSPAVFYGGQFAYLTTRLYREFCEADEFSYISIEGLVIEIMAEAFRYEKNITEPVPPRWLRQIRDIIHEQYSNCPSLTVLAESVDVHPVHLTREFQRFYHCTISEYILRRRMEFSCEQIADSDISLSDIALCAGFFDQSHFTRTFKKHVGLTPNQYRQTFRSR